MPVDSLFFYRIDQLKVRGQSHGCGFSVTLSATAAKFAAAQDLAAGVRSQIKTDLREHVAGLWSGTQLSSVSVMWHENTLLPSGFQVPGEAAQLGATPAALDAGARGESHVEYTDHNVDEPNQALGLITLWTGWAEMIAALAAIQGVDLSSSS